MWVWVWVGGGYGYGYGYGYGRRVGVRGEPYHVPGPGREELRVEELGYAHHLVRGRGRG